MTALDAATLRALSESGTPPRLIDVRTPGEFESAHIPGSYNVPLDVLRDHPGEVRARLGAEGAVLVCRSGQRAAQARQALGAAGARVLTGGLTAWQAAGGEVRTGRARWDLERQVRLVAGAIVLAAILASVAVPAAKWVAGFIGAGLVFAGLTGTCGMGMLLARLPYNRGPRTDPRAVLGSLGEPR